MQASLGFAESSQRLHAVTVGFVLALQWHRSVFTLAIHALCRLHMQCLRDDFEPGLRFCIAVASQCLHAVLQASFGVAVASQWHRSFFTLAMQASLRLRSGIAASSRCNAGVARHRFGIAVASQWLRSVFTPTMQASLGIAEASQRIHAVYAGLASASLWHHSVFTL